MAKVIEEQLKYCSKCGKTTKHHRNNTKSSGFMLLVHLVLTVVTTGIWLVFIIIWKLLNTKIGGWKCSECGGGKHSHNNWLERDLLSVAFRLWLNAQASDRCGRPLSLSVDMIPFVK